MINYNFEGKTVLVTGSSRGMGASVLESFGRAKATCLLNYFNDPEGSNRKDAEATAEKIKAHGAPVHLVEADVSDYESVQGMMTQISEQHGGLDVLVNNAGILADRSVRKMTPEEWHRVLHVNLDGVFYCSKLGAEILKDNGRIVNVASIAGIMGFHGQANYASAKAGVIALTKVMSKELAKRGITVNAVAPGVIKTSMLDSLKPEVLASYENQIPLRRLGDPQEVANVILFFASEESSYVTGQTLPITGGWF